MRCWKATNEAQLSYVEIFLKFLSVFFNFENRAADDEWQLLFSRNFYKPLLGMIQTICRWKDIDDTQLFHVEHSL